MGMWDMPARRVVTDTELRFNPYHDPQNGRFTASKGVSQKNKLTNPQKSVKLDSKGVSYEHPELRLPKKEYGKVIRAIDDLYASKYEGKSSGWLTLSKETYHFEIHGFNEYNIYEKRKD